ncbi:hypothetical protein KIN20_025022 [Parelaphostrongylus tenuis]|uniref:Uncharacterized protein n=1 Tax=Parelaphostrongylus tenuis TaxID=148309 RepID=A0AAD5QWD4_PARTN|nr:hypothetical protein KIN20_025022 [Parelaphostrongylus tenuis]
MRDPARLVTRARDASPSGGYGNKREPKATMCLPETQVDSAKAAIIRVSLTQMKSHRIVAGISAH